MFWAIVHHNNIGELISSFLTEKDHPCSGTRGKSFSLGPLAIRNHDLNEDVGIIHLQRMETW